MFDFLHNKFRDVKIGSLIFLELEGWLYWPFHTLPGAVGIFLRNIFYKLLFKELRGIAWIQPRVIIVDSHKLRVGMNCGINTGTYINAKGGITIGNDVLIGTNVTISSGKHPIEGKEPSVFQRPTQPLPIIVEDDVWIGSNAVIMPGVTLKRGSVVGAGTIVTKDTEEYSVVVGAPAKIIRYRYEKD